ncbi:MAG: methionine--tRNA ligase [Firmicutes bacterium]|nr:methionine--tRNA ligase [Bacillota bacterium]
MKTFYITTPIYFPSGKWHLGSAYTTVLADCIARYKRLKGFKVFFLTGTDEHGSKIENNAKNAGVTPKQFVDKIVADLKNLWKVMDISNDKFIRTTEEYHQTAVQKIFTKLYEKGDIYKSTYEGRYCVPCESFWTETQAKDGKCPDCGRLVEKAKEESYFFKLSKYQDRLIKYFEDNPVFLLPKFRVNEMMNNFLKSELRDLAVSRTSFFWGIKVPFDNKHIVYVWLDALTNYITALGYGSDNQKLFDEFWPADVHLMAKEIVRFHSIIWPAILMALEIPLPKKVYGHGWLLMGGDKLSKSKSDAVKKDVVDPFVLCERYGSDAVRYVLAKCGPFLGDAPYTNETLISTINTDLANSLGNLHSRTIAMIKQYFKGVIPKQNVLNETDLNLINAAKELQKKYSEKMDELNVPAALDEILKVIFAANKYIDLTMPWILFKEKNMDKLSTVLYNLAAVLRVCISLLTPVLVKSGKTMLEQLGQEVIKNFDKLEFSGLKDGVPVLNGDIIFPRLNMEKEKKELEKIAAQSSKEQETKKENAVTLIDIEDFSKVKLKTAKVLNCEKVENSDKLLKLTLKIKNEERQVVSGIAKYYKEKELIDKTVVLVYNLKPAVLRGIESQGMILCAEDEEGNLSIVSPEKSIASGSTVR